MLAKVAGTNAPELIRHEVTHYVADEDAASIHATLLQLGEASEGPAALPHQVEAVDVAVMRGSSTVLLPSE